MTIMVLVATMITLKRLNLRSSFALFAVLLTLQAGAITAASQPSQKKQNGTRQTLITGATNLRAITQLPGGSMAFGFIGLIVAVGARRVLDQRFRRRALEHGL